MNDLAAAHAPLQYNILTIWHNSFDDIVGNASDELNSKLARLMSNVLESWAEQKGMQPCSAAVLASVNQGRKLRSLARRVAVPLNRGFRGMVCALGGESRTSGPMIRIGSGLGLTVLCPTMEQLERLHRKWEKTLYALHKGTEGGIASYVDRSVTNLSSIVVLVEVEGKRMLLTGDARGDHVLDGLERAGKLNAEGRIHVDLFKVPHHGSSRNVTQNLFERVTADHYVISANGEHGNPDPEIFEWIANARSGEEYSIYVTNKTLLDPKKNIDVGAVLQNVIDANPQPGRKVVYRKDGQLSISIDLSDGINY